MSLQTKVIGRQPTDHGPYDPNLAYGKKFQCTLFGCAWESLHDNNNTAPAVWDGGDTITPNLVDWKKVSGSYEAWLMNHDKPAASEQYPFNGMGRVTLQKNIVNGVNTLTQAMLTQQNTIYVIQYDFTLAENITVPANSVLEFDGGSISGAYTVTGNNTTIKAEKTIIFDGVSLEGTFNNEFIEAEWFSDINDAAVAAKATLVGFRLSKNTTLSAPLDLFDIRYINIKADIINTESNALILGYDSRSGEYCKFEIQKVTYSRILGGKNMDVYIQEGTKLELYPDSTVTDKTSIAYCRFLLGAIDNLYITGNANGWCNENTFLKGRFKYVYISGDNYPHNNNIFYNPAIENTEGINITKGNNNRFYDCRLEGSVNIQFGENTFGNRVYYSWLSIDIWSVSGWTPYNNLITNNGDSSNIVSSIPYEKEDTFVINKNTIIGKRNLKYFSVIDGSDNVRCEGQDLPGGATDLSHSSLKINATQDFGLALNCIGSNNVLRWTAFVYDTNGNVFKNDNLINTFVSGGLSYNSETGAIISNNNDSFVYIPVLATRIKKLMTEESLVLSYIQFTFRCSSFRQEFTNISITYLRPFNCYDKVEFALNGGKGITDKVPTIASSYAEFVKPSYVIMDGEEVFCTLNNKMYKRVGNSLYTSDYTVIQ